jgi:hydroxyacylglutathione hydrolase
MEIDFTAGAPVRGDFDVHWIHGSPRRKDNTDPAFQVHAYDQHTYVLRQSKAATFEAPFLYLMFGNSRALLLDTGVGPKSNDAPLRAVIDRVVASWLADNPRDSYELVVAHTHGHGDHVGGDGQFADRPHTTVVGREASEVHEFFGVTSSPEQVQTFDLGGRVLEVFGSPGHHRAAITVYDPWTGFLLTGDTVLRGRLYVQDFPAFLASLDKMVEFADTRPISHVLGCHIEMTKTPGRDYPLGCTYQPAEPPLQMTVQQLSQVRDAARQVATSRGRHVFDDFIIFNEPSAADQVRLIAGGLAAKVLPSRAR